MVMDAVMSRIVGWVMEFDVSERNITDRTIKIGGAHGGLGKRLMEDLC